MGSATARLILVAGKIYRADREAASARQLKDGPEHVAACEELGPTTCQEECGDRVIAPCYPFISKRQDLGADPRRRPGQDGSPSLPGH